MTTTNLQLSNRMIEVLANATLTYEGDVICFVTNGNTQKALERRGATPKPSTCAMSLNLALTIKAVKLYLAPQYVTEYIDHQLDTYGQCDSGRGPATTAGMWARVRSGQLTAERGMVAGWGSYHRGWIFRPVTPTEPQRLAADRVANELANLPKWQRQRMGLSLTA